MATAQKTAEKGTKQSKGTDRDARGRFTEGNKGGPGNPFARQVALLRASLMVSNTPQDVIRVGVVLKEKALGGDVAAIKLYFQYILGKPAETVDPDRLAIDEWKQLKEIAIDPQELDDVVQQCPAEVACELVKMQWPGELERNLREAAEEYARIEAEVEEDERYMEQKEAAEAEALKQKAEAAARRPAQDTRPSRDSQPASARQEAQTATPKTAGRHSQAPSTKRASGTSPREACEPAPSEISDTGSFISRLARRLRQRVGEGMGGEDAVTGPESPSTDGQ